MGMAGVTTQNGPVCHRRPSPLWVHAHPFAVRRVPGDGRVHGAGRLFQRAHAHRLVFPVEGVVLELCGQGQVGGVVFGGDDEPRGVPVNAVDDAGPQRPVDSGEAISTVI